MNNVLTIEDKDLHNVQYLLRRVIQETKSNRFVFVRYFLFSTQGNLLCKPLHVDEKKDFVMSMYFDSMQMHEEEFLIIQVEDFDGNHSFEQPKFSMEILEKKNLLEQ